MAGVLHARIGTEQRAPLGHVLVLANEAWFDVGFLEALAGAARRLTSVDTGAAALTAVADAAPDLILAPEQLPDMPGIEFLRQLRDRGCDSEVVMVFDEDGLERGAEALELGAREFLIRPIGLDQTLASLSLVATSRGLRRENDRLRRVLNELKTGAALVGCSPAARRLVGCLARVAETSATVLIEGRPGVGKTLAAGIVHASGRRSEKPLVIEHCDCLSLERITAELQDERGGTLLLENVEQLGADLQSKLVRHIKERSSSARSDADARVITTTSVHLPELVARGKFREDLYYRLNVFPIVVPSLQERRDDVSILATYFLEQASRESSVESDGFSPTAMILLETHPWPGNVAQLQNTIFRAHALAKHAPIDRQHLLGPTTGLTFEPAQSRDISADQAAADEEEDVREEDILPLEAEEKRLLARALRATGGNVRRAAQLLRIGRATLYRKIQVYQLKLN